MDSKVVVITGASSGIGAAIAVHLAEVGYRKLVIVARRDDRLQEVAAECKSKADGVEVLIVKMDLGVPENNAEVVKKTVAHFGRLDILINNAGAIGSIAPIAQTTLENFLSVINLNLVGPFAISREALPHIEKVKGSIIFVSSIYGTSPQLGIIPYNTSKAALTMLAKSFALEAAPKGVRVNVLSPGFVSTEMFDPKPSSPLNLTREERIAAMASRNPVGRISESLEMAKLCAFLISDDNSFMTGSEIVSDGGFMLTSKDFKL